MSIGWYLIPLNITVSSKAPTTNIASCLPERMKTSGKDMNEDDNSIKQKGNVCTQW